MALTLEKLERTRVGPYVKTAVGSPVLLKTTQPKTARGELNYFLCHNMSQGSLRSLVMRARSLTKW